MTWKMKKLEGGAFLATPLPHSVRVKKFKNAINYCNIEIWNFVKIRHWFLGAHCCWQWQHPHITTAGYEFLSIFFKNKINKTRLKIKQITVTMLWMKNIYKVLNRHNNFRPSSSIRSFENKREGLKHPNSPQKRGAKEFSWFDLIHWKYTI